MKENKMDNIKEGMLWPPASVMATKMAEHSAWYSGDPEIIANYYNGVLNNNFLQLPYTLKNGESFWGRQIKNQGEIFVHVPIAGDIAETSANLLFGEAPIIRFDGKGEAIKAAQKSLDEMLDEVGFNRKLLEGAELCASLGGVFLRLAWDIEMSPYPFVVVNQPDQAIPVFKYGMLNKVVFWKVLSSNEAGTIVYRLLEEYSKGYIKSYLYKGTSDRLGKSVDLKEYEGTQDIEEVVVTPDLLLAVYIPNALPNRLDRTSYLGRSDLSGIEGLMDSLDETFSLWVREIALAQAKVFIPEQYLRNSGGKQKFNLDTMLYVKLDVDPVNDSQSITPQQFEIRADEFEKTVLNLMDRIITGAGYSPQSFGLAIQGRAESGLALQLRERKSFSTKAKKEKYWADGIKKLVEAMIAVYNYIGGNIQAGKITVSFSDGVMNNFTELSTAVAQISSAMAASTETKVRLLHPEWDEDSIAAEVEKILDENGLKPVENPDIGFDNPDEAQINSKE
jgi:A118 family predicted phage portal protein